MNGSLELLVEQVDTLKTSITDAQYLSLMNTMHMLHLELRMNEATSKYLSESVENYKILLSMKDRHYTDLLRIYDTDV